MAGHSTARRWTASSPPEGQGSTQSPTKGCLYLHFQKMLALPSKCSPIARRTCNSKLGNLEQLPQRPPSGLLAVSYRIRRGQEVLFPPKGQYQPKLRDSLDYSSRPQRHHHAAAALQRKGSTTKNWDICCDPLSAPFRVSGWVVLS